MIAAFGVAGLLLALGCMFGLGIVRDWLEEEEEEEGGAAFASGRRRKNKKKRV
jgi:hypothetical protein